SVTLCTQGASLVRAAMPGGQCLGLPVEIGTLVIRAFKCCWPTTQNAKLSNLECNHKRCHISRNNSAPERLEQLARTTKTLPQQDLHPQIGLHNQFPPG